MSDLTQQVLESVLGAKRLVLDAESDSRLKDALAKTPAQTGSAYLWKDHLDRLTDVFRIEEERRVSEAQSTLLNKISARIDQLDGDIVGTTTTVLDREAIRIRDWFAARWDEVVPRKISPPGSQDGTLQEARQGLAIHAEASRYWRSLDIEDRIRSLKSASDLYKANMKAAEANEASARASEASAKAAEKMVNWTRWAALFTALAAIATAVSAWTALHFHH